MNPPPQHSHTYHTPTPNPLKKKTHTHTQHTCTGFSSFLKVLNTFSPSFPPLCRFAITTSGFHSFTAGGVIVLITSRRCPLHPSNATCTQLGGSTSERKGPSEQESSFPLGQLLMQLSCAVLAHQTQRKSHSLGTFPHGLMHL